MKRTRTIILATVLVIALFATVLPALADGEVEFNWSFMGDKDGDNVPDKWNVKGDVFRVCDHPYTSYTYDACMMVFPPSNRAAAVWQRATDPLHIIVVTEEGSLEDIGGFFGATKALDAYRGYFGVRVKVSDGSVFTVYDYIPYGHNTWNTYVMSAKIGGWGDDYEVDDITEAMFGILMTPGDGYLAVDMIQPAH